MEQKIEGTVDKWLERMASGLYLYSIFCGILLIIFGVIILFKKRRDNKFVFYSGFVSIALGFIAIISGIVQMWYNEIRFEFALHWFDSMLLKIL